VALFLFFAVKRMTEAQINSPISNICNTENLPNKYSFDSWGFDINKALINGRVIDDRSEMKNNIGKIFSALNTKVAMNNILVGSDRLLYKSIPEYKKHRMANGKTPKRKKCGMISQPVQ
jgi:hypothetical protein